MMNLILGCSADWRFQVNGSDDMSWTATGDKAIFRALTSVQPGLLGAGRRTHTNLPHLADRDVLCLSRFKGGNGISLPAFREACNVAGLGWLIGGPEIACIALRMGLVTQAYILRSTKIALGDFGRGEEVAHILHKRNPQQHSRISDELELYRYDLMARKYRG